MELYYKGHPSWRRYLHFILPAFGLFLFGALLLTMKSPPEMIIKLTIYVVKAIQAAGVHGSGDFYRTSVSYAAFAISAILFLVAWIDRLMLTYYIDGEDVVSKAGIVSIRVKTIRVSDIRSTKYIQSVLQRIFNVGDIVFSSAADIDDDVYFFSVNDPKGIIKKIDSLRSNYEDERRSRGAE